MADVLSIQSASGVVHTGNGQLVGLVVTSSAGAPLITIYDNTSASGTKIFEAYVSYLTNLVIFFPDRFAPRFSNGLYVNLASGLTCVVWSRQL